MGNIRFRYKIFSTAIVLLIFSIFFADFSFAKERPNPWIRVGRTSSGVVGVLIKAKSVPLRVLLEKITIPTGIVFYIPENFLEDSISVDLEAETWTQAVQEIIKDYSRVETWGQDQQLAGVYVMETTNLDGPLPSSFKNNNSARFARGNRAGTDTGIVLSKGQLVKLVRGPFRSAISPKLWEDVKLRKFLQQQGINSPEDLKNLKKAMNIRKAAKIQLRNMRKKKRAR